MAKSETQAQEKKDQPPPGYPSENLLPKKKRWFPRTKKKGDRGFIEGCLAGLCCCWLCEECC